MSAALNRSAQQASKIEALKGTMFAYYNGTGLQYTKRVFAVTLDMAKKTNYLSEMTTQELLDQMDVMEKAITATHPDGYQSNTVFQKALPKEDPMMCLTLWLLNIVCLIQRKALKNDNNNGYLFFN